MMAKSKGLIWVEDKWILQPELLATNWNLSSLDAIYAQFGVPDLILSPAACHWIDELWSEPIFFKEALRKAKLRGKA